MQSHLPRVKRGVMIPALQEPRLQLVARQISENNRGPVWWGASPPSGGSAAVSWHTGTLLSLLIGQNLSLRTVCAPLFGVVHPLSPWDNT